MFVAVRGQRLKTTAHIAYIAYIIVLINVQAMAARPRGHIMQGNSLRLRGHCLHRPHCKLAVSCQDSVRKPNRLEAPRGGPAVGAHGYGAITNKFFNFYFVTTSPT